MINNCIEDRIDMAKDIALIRKGGQTNMYHRTRVIELLYEEGLDFTAEYLYNNPTDYTDLLKMSGKY